MVYMMQQIAPGRCTMTHYAFATALMNFMLVPTTMISGPLAEWLGFSTFFLVVMFASVPSVIAAWRAPFPLKDDDAKLGGTSEPDQDVVTVDDPTRLTPGERAVQLLAGRASIYAMLNVLMILLVDAKILGSLQGRAEGTGATQFYLLLGTTAAKIFLAVRTFQYSAKAKEESARTGDAVYVRNARGAVIATICCGLATLLVLGFAADLAF
jgi:MFS transporter, PAT family, beta-lactamase induction signal transducer AmpG